MSTNKVTLFKLVHMLPFWSILAISKNYFYLNRYLTLKQNSLKASANKSFPNNRSSNVWTKWLLRRGLEDHVSFNVKHQDKQLPL